MKIEDYFKYYIQGSDHYLIPKDVFVELFDEMINWKEESKKQKEVIYKAIQLLEDDNICADIRRMKPKWNENKYGVEYELLDILKEVSE